MARYCNKCERKMGFFEQNFDGMCKECYNISIEEERKRLEEQKNKKREEEERRKQEEEKKRLEKLAKEKEKLELLKSNMAQDFRQNPFLVYLYNNIYSLETNSLELNLKISDTKKLIDYIVDNAIIQINSSLNRSTIINAFSNFEFFIKMYEQCVDSSSLKRNNIDQWLRNEFNSKKILELFDLFCNIKSLDAEILCAIIGFYDEKQLTDVSKNFYTSMKLDKTYVYDIDEKTYEYTYYYIANFFIFYFYAFEILYAHILIGDERRLQDNTELYKIISNLIEQSMGIPYIEEKVYPIYKLDYLNTFERPLEDHSFLCILWLNNTQYTYKNVIEQAQKILGEIDIDNTKTSNNIVKCIDDSYFFDVIGKLDTTNILNEDIFICYLLINAIKPKDTEYNLFRNIAYKKIDIYKSVEEKRKYYQAQKDKERFLKGDFSKEVEMQKQEVEYSNVQNGYEFEEYVANLYRKLGYTIEEVTKKSGDQRCRCCSI